MILATLHRLIFHPSGRFRDLDSSSHRRFDCRTSARHRCRPLRRPGVTAAGHGYRDAIALAQAAEEAGFDSFWVSEHHGWDDAYLPSPLVLLAALASATNRIELGAGVALAPLYHPMRLASNVAVVDQLSGGRVILGLGLGYIDQEFAAFGVDRSSRAGRLADAIEILRLAGTGQPFSYTGRFIALNDVRVTPRVARASGVPVWLGAYSDVAVRRAGTAADGHLMAAARRTSSRARADGSPRCVAPTTRRSRVVSTSRSCSTKMAVSGRLLGRPSPRSSGRLSACDAARTCTARWSPIPPAGVICQRAP